MAFPAQDPHPATRPLARGLVLTTLLLLAVGGLVTTYRVGMAVQDWPSTFGSTMFAYPLDEMLQSFGVTLEHSHRLLGSIVGLLSLALLLVSVLGQGTRALVSVLLGLGLSAVAIWLLFSQRSEGTGEVSIDWTGPGLVFAGAVAAFLASLTSGKLRGLRALVLVGFVVIVGQGIVGGTRVLENSSDLAFLHGSLAQVVFVILSLVPSALGIARREVRAASQSGPAGLAWLVTLLVLLQSALGAWTRHTGGHMPLGIHGLMALLVVGAILLLFSRLAPLAALVPAAAKMRKGLLHLVGAQFVLGVVTLIVILVVAGGFEGKVSVLEATLSSLHLVTGALLAAACARVAVVSGSCCCAGQATFTVAAAGGHS